MTHTRKGRAAKRRRQEAAAVRAAKWLLFDGGAVIKFPTDEQMIEAEVRDEPR